MKGLRGMSSGHQQEMRVERGFISRLPPCRVLLSWLGPPSKLQLLAGILCIYHPYWGLVPVPSLLLEVPECLGRLTLYLCSSNPTLLKLSSVQFSSVAQSCPTLCNPMDYIMPGLPVHHQLLEFTQTHVHWVGDAIQPSHPLLPTSPPAFSLSQHQGLFQWVSSSHQVAKVLELQLQLQSFQWIFRTDFL